MDFRELEETAQLAHLNVGRDELAAALPAFEQMLGFFAAMQGADDDREAFSEAAHTAGRLHAGQAAGARLAGAADFRGDARPASPGGAEQAAELADAMLDRAGERDNRFLVIPNVL